MTLNLRDRHSPVTLFYTGEKINVKSFLPKLWIAVTRLRLMIENPLSVVQYFYNTITKIINTMLKGGMFKELTHYYGLIEYQGRGTPHTHLVVCPNVSSS